MQSLVTHESPETLNGIIVKLDIFAIIQVLELTLLKQKWSRQAFKLKKKCFSTLEMETDLEQFNS